MGEADRGAGSVMGATGSDRITQLLEENSRLAKEKQDAKANVILLRTLLENYKPAKPQSLSCVGTFRIGGVNGPVAGTLVYDFRLKIGGVAMLKPGDAYDEQLGEHVAIRRALMLVARLHRPVELPMSQVWNGAKLVRPVADIPIIVCRSNMIGRRKYAAFFDSIAAAIGVTMDDAYAVVTTQQLRKSG